MEDPKKMVNNLIYLGIGQIIVVALGLASNAVWARYTTLEQFGSIQLALSFLVIATSLSFPGLKYSAEISAAQEKHGNLKKLIRLKLKNSVVGYCILIGIAVMQLYRSNYEILYLVILIILFFNPIILMECCVGWLNGLNKMKTLALAEITIKALSVISTSLILILFQNIILAIFLFLLSQALTIVYILNICARSRKNCDEDVSLLNYGKAMSWPMLIAALISFDKIIISEYLSLKDVAIYSVALLFANYPKQLHKIFSRVLVARISAENDILQAYHVTTRTFEIFFNLILEASAPSTFSLAQ